MTVTLETGQSAETAATERTSAADTAPRRPSLSPSRAADFKSCPLLYRFRTIDRLPERKTRAAVRGTLVHAVLEKLYDLPAAERTVEAARGLVEPAWAELREEPGVAELFQPAPDGAAGEQSAGEQVTAEQTAVEQGGDPAAPEASAERDGLQAWLASAGELVETYFRLEDPTRIQPEGREELVEVTLPDGLRLRGYVDRLDVNEAGDIRVVDYKTGSTPREAFEAKALFQMKFYALVLWRTRGVVPRQLRLMYLSDTDTLTYAPDAEELLRFERTVLAIWAAIQRAMLTGDFRPSPSRLCDWCGHKALCPSHGGTPPPFPVDATLGDPRDAQPGVRNP
jgi:putative RecB family exonuclease